MSEELLCFMCGKNEMTDDDNLCDPCRADDKRDQERITALQGDGHTHHCACRMVWGDGECECNKRGDIPGRISRMIEIAMGNLKP